MSTMSASSAERCLYRDADRACLGGVCAGVARYMGFNLKVTRLLAVIAFIMTGPVAVVAYLAAVFLIPSASGRKNDGYSDERLFRCGRSRSRRRRRRRGREEPLVEPVRSARAEIVREKCRDLDQRLANLEKHVTSKKFQIEQELSRL